MTPHWARACFDSSGSWKPSTSSSPSSAIDWAVSRRIVVDLPAPFGPSRPTQVPSGHVEVEAVDGRDRAVALDDAAQPNGQAGRSCGIPRWRFHAPFRIATASAYPYASIRVTRRSGRSAALSECLVDSDLVVLEAGPPATTVARRHGVQRLVGAPEVVLRNGRTRARARCPSHGRRAGRNARPSPSAPLPRAGRLPAAHPWRRPRPGDGARRSPRPSGPDRFPRSVLRVRT